MIETFHPVTPSFDRSLRIEIRADRLIGDPGAVVLKEILERSGILGWMTAPSAQPTFEVESKTLGQNYRAKNGRYRQ